MGVGKGRERKQVKEHADPVEINERYILRLHLKKTSWLRDILVFWGLPSAPQRWCLIGGLLPSPGVTITIAVLNRPN